MVFGFLSRGSFVTTSSNSTSAIDSSKPADFEGSLNTTNEIPSAETMLRLRSAILLDRDHASHTMDSILQQADRTLFIFIRHFFCGNCQDYVETLCEEIPPMSLSGSTSIVIVGCGDPDLIDMYAQTTRCKYPIYTDPQRELFAELGLRETLELGEQPKYMRRSLPVSIFSSILQGLKQLPEGLALKSGNHRQVGGEFLFEMVEGQRQVTWCHRMQTTRDHAEMDLIKTVLRIPQ